MFISYTFLFKADGHVGLLTTETLQGPRCWRPYHLNIEPDNTLWQKKRKTGEFDLEELCVTSGHTPEECNKEPHGLFQLQGAGKSLISLVKEGGI